MISRSQVGLLFERLLSSMHAWDGRPLRYLFCYNGEDPGDSYDCACCLTWPNDEMYRSCPCICHERIEKMATAGDIPLLFYALGTKNALPEFPASMEDEKDLREIYIKEKWAHFHNTNGKYANYSPLVCSVCVPSDPPHKRILFDSKTGELLPLAAQKLGPESSTDEQERKRGGVKVVSFGPGIASAIVPYECPTCSSEIKSIRLQVCYSVDNHCPCLNEWHDEPDKCPTCSSEVKSVRPPVCYYGDTESPCRDTWHCILPPHARPGCF
jgi:hypothetical protein